MKKISKLTKLLFLFLSILSCLTPYASVLAESVANTLTATHYEITPPISFPAEFNVIKTTGGKYVYCMQYTFHDCIDSCYGFSIYQYYGKSL